MLAPPHILPLDLLVLHEEWRFGLNVALLLFLLLAGGLLSPLPSLLLDHIPLNLQLLLIDNILHVEEGVVDFVGGWFG